MEKADANINELGFPIDLEYGKFRFVKLLDSGGQGIVCLYDSIPPRNEKEPVFPSQVAVKFDPTTETSNLGETLWLKKQTERIDKESVKINIPRYYMHSFYKSRRFFVMTYLPQSVQEYINQSLEKGHTKEEMIAEVGVKMLDVVQRLHQMGFLHRDIKPSNFRVKDGKVYLTDFGTVRAYLDDDGNHIQEQNQQFLGTLEYASIRTHQCKSQSRRDDLETLGYTILDLMTDGNVDFFKVDRSRIGKQIDPNLHKQLVTQKSSFFSNPNISPMFFRLRDYMQCVSQLEFCQEPNYEQLQNSLLSLHGGLDDFLQDIYRLIFQKMLERSKQKHIQSLLDIVSLKKNKEAVQNLCTQLFNSVYRSTSLKMQFKVLNNLVVQAKSDRDSQKIRQNQMMKQIILGTIRIQKENQLERERLRQQKEEFAIEMERQRLEFEKQKTQLEAKLKEREERIKQREIQVESLQKKIDDKTVRIENKKIKDSDKNQKHVKVQSEIQKSSEKYCQTIENEEFVIVEEKKQHFMDFKNVEELIEHLKLTDKFELLQINYKYYYELQDMTQTYEQRIREIKKENQLAIDQQHQALSKEIDQLQQKNSNQLQLFRDSA